MTSAPYHHEICNGPETGYALWRNASDGVRLRVGLWPVKNAKSTLLIFTGRTEYIEKYAHVAADFNAAGYAVASIDWRGQGLSDRLTDNQYRGHVGKFSDYQKDVAVLLDTVKSEGLPAPVALLGHSMGGCIGLRSLLNGIPVKGAIFSAPMWNILMSPALRPFAWTLSRFAKYFGAGASLVPGTNERSFVLEDSFEDNTLTRDTAMWEMMGKQVSAVPQLELGGPSLHWLKEALKECGSIMRAPAPNVRTLTFLGDNERIVDAPSVVKKMANWPNGMLRMVDAAEHEVFMEVPATRTELTAEAVAFLDSL